MVVSDFFCHILQVIIRSSHVTSAISTLVLSSSTITLGADKLEVIEMIGPVTAGFLPRENPSYLTASLKTITVTGTSLFKVAKNIKLTLQDTDYYVRFSLYVEESGLLTLPDSVYIENGGVVDICGELVSDLGAITIKDGGYLRMSAPAKPLVIHSLSVYSNGHIRESTQCSSLENVEIETMFYNTSYEFILEATNITIETIFTGLLDLELDEPPTCIDLQVTSCNNSCTTECNETCASELCNSTCAEINNTTCNHTCVIESCNNTCELKNITCNATCASELCNSTCAEMQNSTCNYTCTCNSTVEIPETITDLIVKSNRTFELGVGFHNFTSITIRPGGVLRLVGDPNGTHTTTVYADVVNIMYEGIMEGIGKGYQSGGPGMALESNQGASHGGNGLGNNAPPYGNVRTPHTYGSNGKDATDNSKRGGGQITLFIKNSTRIDGEIDFSGQATGSGGSVYIVTPEIHGAGTIRADGGTGGGGGGRISVLVDDIYAFTGELSVKGGNDGLGKATSSGLYYSKTCLKRPLKNRHNKDLNDK